MNIFITGASGYLGSNVIRKLSNFKFFALHHRSPVIDVPSVIPIKIENDKYESFFLQKNIDSVIHLASNTNRGNDAKYKNSIYQANVELGERLLKASSRTNVKKFIYSGSYSQDIFINEPNYYIRSKNLFETVIKEFENDFDILNMHLGDIYGPSDSRDKLIPYLLRFENEKFINFSSDGTGPFAPIYIDDIIKEIKSKLNESDNAIKYQKIILASEVMTVKKFVVEYKKIRNKNFEEIYENKGNNPYSSFQIINPNKLKSRTQLKEGLRNL
jgi:nucleoside-diphosphate-sugar epimerase